MSDHMLRHGTRETEQTQPAAPGQIRNEAGGYAWEADIWTRLHRFLILGTEGGTYYTSEFDLTKENVDGLRACIHEDGQRAVREIVEVSRSGRAPKNDPALFALANAISLGDTATKRAAAEALPQVARIATHLYHFAAYAETMRGWGRTMRWAVSNWYRRSPEQLALQAVKYRQRDGWTLRDLLRLAHPESSPVDGDTARVFEWICRAGGTEGLPQLIEGFQLAQESASPEETAALVHNYKLPREALLPEHLTSAIVWRALLEEDMPLTAMVRNLANMTRVGALDDLEHRVLVLDTLSNAELIRGSRLHPIALLTALRTYASGRGYRGGNTWTPKPAITDALDAAFYLAFDNVESSGGSFLLAIDISGSMTNGEVGGVPNLTPCEAAAAMALVTLHAEPDCEVIGFSDRIFEVGLSRRQRLDDAARTVHSLSGSGTDCSLPTLYAIDRGVRYDGIAQFTDNQTWAGHVHVSQAIRAYRERVGVPTRLVACGMTATRTTLNDPSDALSLDVVGFDTAAPQLISDFTAGRM